MAIQFPIKLTVTGIAKHHDALVEVKYDALDAAEVLIKSSYFYCKPDDIEEVYGYTLARLSLALAQPSKSGIPVSMSSAAAESLAVIRQRASAKKPSAPPVPTPLDQTISPPGVVPAKGATK